MSNELVESLHLVKRIAGSHAKLLSTKRGAQHADHEVTDAVIRLESAALKLNIALGRSIDNESFREMVKPQHPGGLQPPFGLKPEDSLLYQMATLGVKEEPKKSEPVSSGGLLEEAYQFKQNAHESNSKAAKDLFGE